MLCPKRAPLLGWMQHIGSVRLQLGEEPVFIGSCAFQECWQYLNVFFLVFATNQGCSPLLYAPDRLQDYKTAFIVRSFCA